MADPRSEIASEQAVLGAMLLSSDAVGVALEVLSSSDFYRPAHEELFSLICELFAESKPTSSSYVLSILTERKAVRQGYLDGAVLLNLVQAAEPAAVRFHAQRVRGAAVARRVREAASRVVSAVDAGMASDDVVELAFSEMMQSATSYDESGAESLSDLLPRALDEIEQAKDGVQVGISTGLTDLDRVVTGLRPDQLVIVAGRPAMGKSTLGLDICRSAALHQRVPTLLVSLEMGKTEIVKRLVSAEAQVDLNDVTSGQLSDNQWDRVANVVSRVSESPLFIDEPAGLSPRSLLAKARRMVVTHKIGLVVVDYLQLMHSTRSEGRQQEVSDISASLKSLARSLHVPVVALSQLNRAVEHRTEKKPMLSDLRESGSLEQDADVVILVHRQEYYEPNDPDHVGMADLIVAKQRNGPTGDVRAVFQGQYARFANYARY